MAQPTQTISRAMLESARVRSLGRTYEASIQGVRVVVDGGVCSWATVAGDNVRLTLGAKVPAARGDSAGGTREGPRGGGRRGGDRRASQAGSARAPDPVDLDGHVALGARRNAQLAMRHTWVDTPQAEHLKELDKSLRIEWIGD